jgi:hypothetical protein
LTNRIAKILAFVVIFSLMPNSANAEQLKRYKITYPDGSFVMNSGTTNPIVVEGYPSIYSTIVFYHDPSGLNNALCAAGCRPVLDSYQNDVTEGVPISTDTSSVSTTPVPTPQPTQNPLPTSDRAPLGGLEIELYSISQNDFQWTLNAIANNSRVITYSNFSYSWSATGPAGVVDSGNSGSSNLIESSQGQIASFHLKNLRAGVSYIISVDASNAGSSYRISRTFTTKNATISSTAPLSDTTTATSDTKTVTVDTRTVTTDTRTVNVISDTSTSISNKETMTISSVQDTKTINSVVASLTVEEREEQLQISLRNNKTALINVSTEFAGTPLKITATRKGYKSITINLSTDLDGNAQLTSSRNLRGFTVVLSIGKVKLDTDLVRK